VMALLTDDRPEAKQAVSHGVDYLLAKQSPQGDWAHGAYTVLGIDPYTNSLYGNHWPLMALGSYYQSINPQKSDSAADCDVYRVAYQSLPDAETGGSLIGGPTEFSFSLSADDSGQARLWIENKGKYIVHDLNFSLSLEGTSNTSAQSWSLAKLESGSRESWRVKLPSATPLLWRLNVTYIDVGGRTFELTRSIELEGNIKGLQLWSSILSWLIWTVCIAGIGVMLALGLARHRPLLTLGLRNLRRHPLRTLLTSAGVILGTAAIGATLTLTLAFRTKLIEDFATFGTNRIIVLPYQLDFKFGPPTESLRKQPGSRFTDADVARVKALPQVIGASAFVQEDLPIEHSGQLLQMTVKFVDAESYTEVITTQVESGRFLLKDKRREIVLGYAAAHEAFERPIEVGSKVKVDGNEFTVVGIMAEVGGIRGRQGAIISPDIVIYGSLKEAIEFTSRNYYDGIEARAESASVTEATAGKIEDVIKQTHINTEVGVTSSQRLLAQVKKLLAQFTSIVVMISLLTLIVSGIGVANMMLVSVHERIQEIGIMKAIGARDRTVLIIFLSEAGSIGLLSAAVGAALGFLLLLLLKYIAGVSVLPVAPYLLIFSLIFSVLITVICGSYPACLAARLEPAEAIRHA